MLWVILVMLIIVWILIYLEKNDRPELESGLSVNDLYKDVDNIELTNWRISILIGIVSTLPIVYYIEGRIPTLFEWIIIGTMISMTVYLSSDWRNSEKFHQQKNMLLEKISKLKQQLDTQTANIPQSDLNLFNYN